VEFLLSGLGLFPLDGNIVQRHNEYVKRPQLHSRDCYRAGVGGAAGVDRLRATTSSVPDILL